MTNRNKKYGNVQCGNLGQFHMMVSMLSNDSNLSELNQYHSYQWSDINEQQHLMTIFKNILDNPSNMKYQNLNLDRVIHLFSKHSIYLQILLRTGFHQSSDGKRLLFDGTYLDYLKQKYIAMKKFIENHNQMQCTGKLNFELIKSKKDLHVLCKIFSNILTEPNNFKFQMLDTLVLKRKFDDPIACVQILAESGFSPIDEGKYLVFNTDCFSNMKSVYYRLELYLNNAHKNNTKKASKNDSIHLLNMDDSKECKCDSSICPSLQVISNILKKYDTFLNEDNQTDILTKVTCINLVNDFNHLLSYHAQQFEDFYRTLNQTIYGKKGCNMLYCKSLVRHQRNREQISDNKDLPTIYSAEQQLLDRIHCYYLHSFDTGYKLTNQEKHDVLNNTNSKNTTTEHQKITFNLRKLIRLKRRSYQNVVGLKRLVAQNNKFTTEEKSSAVTEYSYGWRFFYWDYYKDNNATCDEVMPRATMGVDANNGFKLGDWYINKKHESLKDELLKNEICTIDNNQWNNLIEKGEIHLQTDKAKKMHCTQQIFEKCYGIYCNQQIGLNHLAAMMLHCNYDTLQNRFGETFRKVSVTETDSSLKHRHSNYYFFAKCLRECVECFGMNVQRGTRSIHVFHGNNQYFTFASLNARVKGPFSTTTNYSVAVNFSNNQGMIMQLDMLTNSVTDPENLMLPTFDCQWISDFVNENEIFTIGGCKQFIVRSIIHASIGNVVKDYEQFIKGLHLITKYNTNGGLAYDQIMDDWFCKVNRNIMNVLHFKYVFKSRTKLSSQWEPPLPKEKKLSMQMAFRLLCHELWRHKPNYQRAHQFKSCPKYFKKILHSHCQNVKLVHLEPVNKIQNNVFLNKQGLIDLNVITTVFPNCERILYCATDQNESMINKTLYQSIIPFIQQNKNTKLEEIVIIAYRKVETQLKNCWIECRELFNDVSWNAHWFSDISRDSSKDKVSHKKVFKSMFAPAFFAMSMGVGTCLVLTKPTVKVPLMNIVYKLTGPF
eukprot:193694_1